jgi:hypothetical protein
MEALNQAKKRHLNGRWWIKADGCDVRKGLRESLRSVWAGDEDVGNGAVKAIYDKYQKRRTRVNLLLTGSSASATSFCTTMKQIEIDLRKDLDILVPGKENAKLNYEKSVGRHISETSLMELAWDSIGFEELCKQCQCLVEEVTSIIDTARCISLKGMHSLKTRLLQYLKDLYSKKRKAATHLLVFMVADELRNTKPYAIPVRFIPYHSITDAKVRDLEDELERAMTSIGMTVVG